MEGVGVIIEGVGWALEFLFRGLMGWGFIFSPRFRRQTLERWQDSRSSIVAIELTGGAVGVLLSLWVFAWALDAIAT